MTPRDGLTPRERAALERTCARISCCITILGMSAIVAFFVLAIYTLFRQP